MASQYKQWQQRGLLIIVKYIATYLFVMSSAAFTETLRFSVAEWPPHYSKDLPFYGDHAAVVEKVIRQAGFKVKFVWYDDWKAAFNTVKAGRHHATPSWRCTQDRADHFIYTAPIFLDPFVLFYLKGNDFDWTVFSQLKEWEPIGVTAGYNYGKAFNDAVQRYRIQLHQVRIDRLMLKLLLKDRIQLALFSRENGLSLIKKHLNTVQQQRITYHPQPVLNSIYHILFSKNMFGNVDIVKKINQQIKINQGLFEVGLQKIQKSWGGCK